MPTKVGIHGFAARAKASRGWRAPGLRRDILRHHDDGRRPESRDFQLLVLLPVRRIIRQWNERHRWARFWLVRRTAVFGVVRLSPSPGAWASSVGRRWARRDVTRWWRRRWVVTGWIPISLRVGWMVKIAGRKQRK